MILKVTLDGTKEQVLLAHCTHKQTVVPEKVTHTVTKKSLVGLGLGLHGPSVVVVVFHFLLQLLYEHKGLCWKPRGCTGCHQTDDSK